MAAASQDNSGLLTDQTIPQWKRELILRRRAQSRTLPAGNTSVKLTCPSVVAAVRQAEPVPPCLGAAAGENVSGNPQRCISSTVHSNKGSLDQALTDFPPGGRISSASSSVCENMRLVEHQAAPGSRMINGVGCDSNISIDQLTYRSKMGEEKSVKKSCASNNRKMDNGVLKSVVVHRENNCSHPNEEELLSDSSEELQYGPGIVKRLKSKYMSMTLRENQNKGVRPSLSNMRRATSLENMLESDETGKPPLIKPQHKFTKRTEATSTTNKSQYVSQHQQRYRSVSRGNDSMKRARSVEALLRYDTKLQSSVANQQPLPIDKIFAKVLSRDEIVIVEKAVPVKTEEKPPIPQPTATRNKKRAIMNASQKAGLPPPDVVKQTLKLFENSQVKSVPAAPKNNGSIPPAPPPLSKLNITMANQSKPAVGLNKPLLSPKPSPEKIRRSPLSKVASPKKVPAPALPPTVPSPVLETPVPPITTSIVTTAPSRVLPLDIPEQSPTVSSFPSPRLKSPSPTNNPFQTILTSTNGTNGSVSKSPTPPFVKPRTPSPVLKARTPSPISRIRSPSPTSKPRVPSPSLRVSPVTNGTSSSPREDPLSGDEDVPDSETVSHSSMENLHKEGSTMEFSFPANTLSDKSKSYLPGGKSHPPQPLPSKAVAKVSPPILGKRAPSPSLPPQNPLSMSPLPILKSPDTSTTHTKKVGIIRPTFSTKVQTPLLTDREIEKNLINRVKSSPVEQPTKVVVSLKPSEIVVGNVSDSVKGRLGMDDSGMKEMVRCVKESNGNGLWDKKKPWNQQQNSMVFNFIDRKDPVPDYIENDGLNLRCKREKIRKGESGIILLDPSVEESSNDYDDDLSTGFTGPPSPCNVHFEGDNILINGKSNLRKQPKQRKLRITFNDNATTMFEYPSEASLISDPAAAAASPSTSTAGLPTPPAPSGGATPGVPAPIGGSSLASYTPSKVSMGSESFQLGVTRTTPLPKPKDAGESTSSSAAKDGADYLKPAEDADNVAWSTDTADDLLF